MASAPQYSFASGEWSPYLYRRSDLAQYAIGCKTLQNMILMKTGSVRRRPGTEHVSGAKFDDKRHRLLTFQFSVTTSFILEMGEGYFRFHNDGAPVTYPGTTVYEIANPYTEAQLRDVQTSQVNNEMRFVHPDHPPYILRRVQDQAATGVEEWTFEEIAYSQPPVRDENLDEAKTITPSAKTGAITLTATGFTFDTSVVGGYYRIGYAREDVSRNFSIVGSNNNSGSDPIAVKGDWEISTFGTWEAEIFLQRRVAGGEWQNLRSWFSNGDRNISADGTELEDDVEFRIFMTRFDSVTTVGSSSRAILEVVQAESYGVAKVTAVAVGGATASATVVTSLAQTNATFRWAEGAWSPARGFPRSLTLHEGRLYYGGNKDQAQTIWASDVDGYDRFTEEDLQDGDSFRVTLGGTEFNGIQWLATSPKNLLIGTTGAEWSLSSGDEENILTATSARAVRESELGSDHLQPVTANNVVLFVQRGGRDISEVAYSFEQDGFINANLTNLAEHVTDGKVVEWDYQKHRDPVVWAITGEGVLIGLTYVRKQEVIGWHRHTTQGTFESVAVVSTGDEEEEIYVSTKRTINGATRRFVERISPDMWRKQEDAVTPDDLTYLDCSIRTTGTNLTSVSLPHLALESVGILADGAVRPNATVAADGSLAIGEPADNIVAGFPYTSIVEPLALQLQTQQGTSDGRQKRIHEIVMFTYKSSAFKFGYEEKLEIYYGRDTSDPLSEPIPLASRTIAQTMPSRWGRVLHGRVVQDFPLPLTLLSMVRNTRVEGDA